MIYAHDRCLFLWSILAYTQGTAVGYVRPSVQQLSFHPAGRNSLPQQTTGRLGLAADNASTRPRWADRIDVDRSVTHCASS